MPVDLDIGTAAIDYTAGIGTEIAAAIGTTLAGVALAPIALAAASTAGLTALGLVVAPVIENALTPATTQAPTWQLGQQQVLPISQTIVDTQKVTSPSIIDQPKYNPQTGKFEDPNQVPPFNLGQAAIGAAAIGGTGYGIYQVVKNLTDTSSGVITTPENIVQPKVSTNPSVQSIPDITPNATTISVVNPQQVPITQPSLQTSNMPSLITNITEGQQQQPNVSSGQQPVSVNVEVNIKSHNRRWF